MKRKLRTCPHCGGEARLVLEAKTRTCRRVRHARIICINNKKLVIPRCLETTVAAPVDEVIWHWDRRKR